ncbi:MAG: SMC-Scp complex subunit ScpB [Planctomycetes bacterium]|nr:SMC-Scp complex subunit ScpB [Planctomycetota bacterium]
MGLASGPRLRDAPAMAEDGEAGVAMKETEEVGGGAEQPADGPPAAAAAGEREEHEEGETEASPSPEAGADAQAGAEAELDMAACNEPGTGTEVVIDSETEVEPGTETGSETESEADGTPTPEDEERLVRSVAALVFASPEPLGVGRLVSLLENPRPARVRRALGELGRRLEACGLPLELRQIAGGWRLGTTGDADEVVRRLQKARKVERLSPAGLETLAVVAYRQPVTKAEVEAIRGVQCGPMLRGLADRGLVRVTGRSDQPGHALEYGTTRAFLDRFGLADLGDLPRDGELLG